ncbi:hypothetical protein DFH07DRAFT_902786 [Mycena maculata]|uniref:NADPH:adrenodoxin oxidoreductase, mitochondrial n=1 Tax=Mycena maculata TaxID=230809 RepID=A0AAD7JJ22_9AGAR|nr:hypothetical protein DFH07DRAFT_902786 [Mycena maculata]
MKLKVAIVGGGPAAFYVASRLLSRIPDAPGSPLLRVHLFDRLWAPHGLVRYGVAPDHPEVKNCTNKFDQVAADPRFRFFGNVNVGTRPPEGMEQTVQLPWSEIKRNYSHLVFATGCTMPALHSALAGSPWCLPALSFVHWYTQHPSAPPAPPLEAIPHVSLIGNGNVALDIARILLTSPAVLEKYDVPQPVLDVLARSAVQHVSIIARRGPLQAAFTAKELRELTNLPDAAMAPIPPALLAPPPGVTPTRQQSRILTLLAQGSRNPFGSTRKTWALEFFKSPTGLAPPAEGETLPELLLTHTALDEHGRAVPAGPAPPLRTALVVPALGFRAEPTTPFFDPALGHLRTAAGRVLGANGRPVKSVYAAGWAATGARGVLATTMMDAYGVADTVLADATAAEEGPIAMDADSGPHGRHSVLLNNAQKGVDVAEEFRMNPTPANDWAPELAGVIFDYEDWKRVDAEEVRLGLALGKERERMGWREADAFWRRPNPARPWASTQSTEAQFG